MQRSRGRERYRGNLAPFCLELEEEVDRRVGSGRWTRRENMRVFVVFGSLGCNPPSHQRLTQGSPITESWTRRRRHSRPLCLGKRSHGGAPRLQREGAVVSRFLIGEAISLADLGLNYLVCQGAVAGFVVGTLYDTLYSISLQTSKRQGKHRISSTDCASLRRHPLFARFATNTCTNMGRPEATSTRWTADP